jgi:hypothetical protein
MYERNGLVPASDARQATQVRVLAFSRRKIQRSRPADRSGNGFVHERIERCGADGCKHSIAIVSRGTDMAASKPVGGVESVHPSVTDIARRRADRPESVGLASFDL